MEYLSEIIIVGQGIIILWLFLDLEDVKEDLDSLIDAHNAMADGFRELLEVLYEEVEDDTD